MPHCKKTADLTNGIFGFCRHSPTLKNQKSHFLLPIVIETQTEKTNFGLENWRIE